MAPNIVYFLVDNLGFGELGTYGGGILRGTPTRNIDRFAREGMKLLNFAPETQCTPSRSALLTGRYSICSGNHTVALAGSHGGLVKWEKTLGDVLSASGYATAFRHQPPCPTPLGPRVRARMEPRHRVGSCDRAAERRATATGKAGRATPHVVCGSRRLPSNRDL